jgi:hypothetical protein
MRRLVIPLVGLVTIIWAVSSATASPADTFSSSPSSGPPGTAISVASVTSCPANPAGVVGPRLVRVTLSRGNTVFSSVRLSLSTSGGWRGTLVVPKSASPGAAALSAFCFSSAMAEGATLAYQERTFTVTAPKVTPAPPAKPITATPTVTG